MAAALLFFEGVEFGALVVGVLRGLVADADHLGAAVGEDAEGVACVGTVVLVFGGGVVVGVWDMIFSGRVGEGAATEAGLDEGLQGGEAGAGDAD